MTDDFFALVAREFQARSAQLRQAVRPHGVSIGAGHEVLLRRFLRDYLPNWVGVGHGFVRDHDGLMSGQSDVVLYNAMYYAPLYRVSDFVVIQPESVLALLETKTTVNKKDFVHCISQLVRGKTMARRAFAGVFVFNPPSLKTVASYIDACGLQDADDEAIPDSICGLSKFYLEKGHVELNRPAAEIQSGPRIDGTAFLQHKYSVKGERVRGAADYTLQAFFNRLFSHLEMRINEDLKSGIDNIWKLEGSSMTPGGRLKYSALSLESVTPVSIVKTFAQPITKFRVSHTKFGVSIEPA